MAANKVTAVHGRCGIKFQATTLSRPGNRTALFLDRQREAARFPEPAAPGLPRISLARLASQLPVLTFQSNMRPKPNDPGNPLDAAAI
jgi:hypothetical protein